MNQGVNTIYYYHPDHLESTSLVTDGSGGAVQYVSYLPYGEQYVEQQYANYDPAYNPQNDVRYKFTGKERDKETGYDYIEQRYYFSNLSIWTRVDPLVDKYPGFTPYNYCIGNPLKYIDPDGRKIFVKGTKEYVEKVMSQLAQLCKMDPELKEMIVSLIRSEQTHTIHMTDKEIGNYSKSNAYDVEHHIPTDSEIGYDPDNETTISGDKRAPIIGLAHELTHSLDADKGITPDKDATCGEAPMDEVEPVRTENIVRNKLGYIKRTSYGNKKFSPESIVDP